MIKIRVWEHQIYFCDFFRSQFFECNYIHYCLYINIYSLWKWKALSVSYMCNFFINDANFLASNWNKNPYYFYICDFFIYFCDFFSFQFFDYNYIHYLLYINIYSWSEFKSLSFLHLRFFILFRRNYWNIGENMHT